MRKNLEFEQITNVDYLCKAVRQWFSCLSLVYHIRSHKVFKKSPMSYWLVDSQDFYHTERCVVPKNSSYQSSHYAIPLNSKYSMFTVRCAFPTLLDIVRLSQSHYKDNSIMSISVIVPHKIAHKLDVHRPFIDHCPFYTKILFVWL